MIRQSKRRVSLRVSWDRISELPDCLITQILSYLSTKESATTSLLSKRWKFLWLSVPMLDLTLDDFPPYGEDHPDSACFIDKYLEFNHRSQMHKLKLMYDETNCYRAEFVEWIDTIVDRGIQHLDVETVMLRSNRDFMPDNIFKSKTLVSLKLVNVGMMSPDFVVSLPCLKIMYLRDIWYGDDPLIMENLISGCPVLEDLTLVFPFDHCDLRVLLFLRVKSQTLKSFHYFFEFNRSGTEYEVEIDAPGLEYLNFRDDQSDRIVVKNLTSLFMIDIDSNFNVEYGTTLHPNDLSKRDTIRDFLTGISSVRHMIISQPTLEVLYQYSKLGPIPKFGNLYCLHAEFSSSMLQLLPVFLESCPNLKNLTLEFSVSRETEKCELSYVPPCLLLSLECVEIKELIMEEENGKKLVKYFLENSVLLKKLILRFKDSSKANQDSDIFKELSTFTKRSSSCQIVIH